MLNPAAVAFVPPRVYSGNDITREMDGSHMRSSETNKFNSEEKHGLEQRPLALIQDLDRDVFWSTRAAFAAHSIWQGVNHLSLSTARHLVQNVRYDQIFTPLNSKYTLSEISTTFARLHNDRIYQVDRLEIQNKRPWILENRPEEDLAKLPNLPPTKEQLEIENNIEKMKLLNIAPSGSAYDSDQNEKNFRFFAKNSAPPTLSNADTGRNFDRLPLANDTFQNKIAEKDRSNPRNAVYDTATLRKDKVLVVFHDLSKILERALYAFVGKHASFLYDDEDFATPSSSSILGWSIEIWAMADAMEAYNLEAESWPIFQKLRDFRQENIVGPAKDLLEKYTQRSRVNISQFTSILINVTQLVEALELPDLYNETLAFTSHKIEVIENLNKERRRLDKEKEAFLKQSEEEFTQQKKREEQKIAEFRAQEKILFENVNFEKLPAGNNQEGEYLPVVPPKAKKLSETKVQYPQDQPKEPARLEKTENIERFNRKPDIKIVDMSTKWDEELPSTPYDAPPQKYPEGFVAQANQNSEIRAQTPESSRPPSPPEDVAAEVIRLGGIPGPSLMASRFADPNINNPDVNRGGNPFLLPPSPSASYRANTLNDWTRQFSTGARTSRGGGHWRSPSRGASSRGRGRSRSPQDPHYRF